MSESLPPQLGLFDVQNTQKQALSDSAVVHKKPSKPRAINSAKQVSQPQQKRQVVIQSVAERNLPPPPSQHRAVSGLVPVGDVRLTANIKEEIHLQLKIVAAHRRTTIGELIEELVEKYLESPYGVKK